MAALLDAKKIMGESRVALSKEIREKLSANIGDILNFIEDDDGRIYIRKAVA